MARLLKIWGLCMAFGAGIAPAHAAVSPQEANAKVAAEIKQSRKVLEAACEAAYAKLPGR